MYTVCPVQAYVGSHLSNYRRYRQVVYGDVVRLEVGHGNTGGKCLVELLFAWILMLPSLHCDDGTVYRIAIRNLFCSYYVIIISQNI